MPKQTFLEKLNAKSKEEIINDILNDKCEEWADFRPSKKEAGVTEERKRAQSYKRIPYIGAYWRATDFMAKDIQIGRMYDSQNDRYTIGVMENNKWDYPERMMTFGEVDIFIGFLDRAFSIANPQIESARTRIEHIFDECWQWFQTLKI